MLLTEKALGLRKDLMFEWNKHLVQWDVYYPEEGANEPALLALFDTMPEPLTQEALTAFYLEHTDMNYNMQVRHLASKGWDIRSGNSRFTQGQRDPDISRDQVRLASVQSPNPVWLADNRLKRVGNIPGLTWTEKLRIYRDHGCAVCGQKFANYDRGHLDPARGFVDDNVVPMCSPCNNWAQDRVTFKLDGLIARPVLG